MVAVRVVTALLAVSVVCWAEPEAPRYATIVEASPYPPSGWHPSGLPFPLPVRQASTFFAPPPEYGIPITTEQPTTEQPTTTEVPITTEDADGNGQDPAQAQGVQELPEGVYYITLPDGGEKRVIYAHHQLLEYGVPAVESPGLNAQVKYQGVPAPVYTFSAPLIRLLKK